MSNSSMQTHPPSANTIAPPVSMNSPLPSLMTDAVRPAAEEPLPEVYTRCGCERGRLVQALLLRNCRLAVDGSRMRSCLTSPRNLAPSVVVFLELLNSSDATAALMSSLPKMAGAMRARTSTMTSRNGRAANALNSAGSFRVKDGGTGRHPAAALHQTNHAKVRSG